MTRPKTVLYLDQNAWIGLARGAWDKAAFPAEHAALARVIGALEADRLIVPLSFANFYETAKIDDPVRRMHMARVQATISGGHVLRGRRRLLDVGLQVRIAQIAGVPLPTLPWDWFLSTLWFETAGELSSGAFDEIPAAALRHMRDHPQAAVYDAMMGSDEVERRKAIRTCSAQSQDLLGRLAKNRPLVANESFAMRLRAYGARLLIEEIDRVLELGRSQGLRWSTVSDLSPALARGLISEVPVLNVERQLAVRLEDQPREPTENDLRDMGAFIAALPLVDVMVAEKQFVNLSIQAKLNARYGTRLLTNLTALTSEILMTPSYQSI